MSRHRQICGETNHFVDVSKMVRTTTKRSDQVAKKKASADGDTATKPARKRATKAAQEQTSNEPTQLAPLGQIPPRDEFEFDMRELLTQFDDHGVAIDETQWRELTDEQQRVATEWLKNRRVDVLTLVPHFLIRYASEQLKNEFEAYREGQVNARRVLMPVTFGKPSFNKNDDGEEMTKLALKIPADNLSDATAGALFRWKRCRIEVSRRPINEWDQAELPAMADGDRRIITAEADISGYKASRHFTDVAYWLDAALLRPEEALDWWKSQGSVRVEVIGEPLSKSDESEQAETSEADDVAPQRPRPTLPNLEPVDMVEPITIVVAKTDEYELSIDYHRNRSGWWTTLASDGPNGWESEQDYPEIPLRQSAEQAVEARIGQQVDAWSKLCADPHVQSRREFHEQAMDIVAQMKHWLSELSQGKRVADVAAQLQKAEA